MAEKLEGWGIVELMGHQRTSGRLSEQAIGGANLLRVDIPEGETFRTVYYGASAIYALHITDEAAARAVAGQTNTRPMYAYELDRHVRQLAAPSRAAASTVADNEPPDDDMFAEPL